MSDKILSLIVEFLDGNSYQIPAQFIAEHKARNHADADYKEGTQEWDQAYAAEMQLALESPYAIIAWAKECVDWSDVKGHAHLLPRPAPRDDYSREWKDAPMEIVELPRPPTD